MERASTRGRPTKCTPELTTRIAELLHAGAYVERACAEVGISTSTFYRWRRKGEEGRAFLERLEAGEPRRDIDPDPDEVAPFVGFCSAAERAQSAAEIRDLLVISAAARAGDWRAAAWRLERRCARLWGREGDPAARARASGAAAPETPGSQGGALDVVVVGTRSLTEDEFRNGVHVARPYEELR
jgi:transposase-like protein